MSFWLYTIGRRGDMKLHADGCGVRGRWLASTRWTGPLSRQQVEVLPLDSYRMCRCITVAALAGGSVRDAGLVHVGGDMMRF